ncbi:MAG: RAMP superfamily CRISPR-associated protein [Thermaerobacter sp.]|nr:RAMP superfamily CRISPR-associated protein [Thermaerobacter sp.]
MGSDDFELCLELCSDWHVGAGTGLPGNVDSQVVRDEDGIPYVPAKSIIGVWRDACELVAWGLDNGAPNVWTAWVRYIFGHEAGTSSVGEYAVPAALSVRPARFPEQLRALVIERLAVREALTFLQPGVKVDADSGNAITKFLRFIEVARGPVTLTAPGRLAVEDLSADQAAAARCLLLAGAKAVERLGGKRRRGLGRCRLTVGDLEGHFSMPGGWQAWLEEHARPDDPPSANRLRANRVVVPNRSEESPTAGWMRVPLHIELIDPVVVPQRYVGNVVRCLDFIPGTYFLPMISRLLEEAGEDPRELFASGSVAVLHAYPNWQGNRTLPIPLSFWRVKDKSDVYNRLVEQEEIPEQLRQMRGGYLCAVRQGRVYPYVSAKINTYTHNRIEDAKQRPSEEVGGIYTYEALAPGTKWIAEIRMREALWRKIKWDNMPRQAFIGRSKKDDFGRVHLEVGEAAAMEAQQLIPDGSLNIWLTSPALLRDGRLRPSSGWCDLAEELSCILGVTVHGKDKCFVREFRLDSWHVGWGMPRPSLYGLAAGSCGSFTLGGPPDRERLDALMMTGLGERRAEGYGQVVLHPELLGEAMPWVKEWEADAAESGAASKPAAAALVSRSQGKLYALAERLERDAWRNEIAKRAFLIADEVQPLLDGGVTEGQLGALRALAERMQFTSGPKEAGEMLQRWVQGVGETANRRSKGRGQIDPRLKRLLDYDERQKMWDEYLKLDEAKLSLTEDGITRLRDELWPEALGAVLVQAIRRHQDEGVRDDGAKAQG